MYRIGVVSLQFHCDLTPSRFADRCPRLGVENTKHPTGRAAERWSKCLRSVNSGLSPPSSGPRGAFSPTVDGRETERGGLRVTQTELHGARAPSMCCGWACCLRGARRQAGDSNARTKHEPKAGPRREADSRKMLEFVTREPEMRLPYKPKCKTKTKTFYTLN